MKSVRTSAIGACVAAALLVTPAAAGGDQRSVAGGFRYTEVREGVPAAATRFTLTSPDVRQGEGVPERFWADGFGCSGGNQQIRLSWKGAPAGTRSFAVTMQDVDAPTGSGFWHWAAWDIPVGSTGLGAALPAGAVAGLHDGGATGYLGPCPPVGDVRHRYRITVHALDVPSLGLPATSTPAVAAFTMSGHITAYGRLTVTAQR